MANARGTGRRRGRPIGSRNTRVNQYIRIRSLIWQKRKEQYESYFDPALLNISRRVNDECKTAGTDCDDDLILTFHDEWAEGGSQFPIPFINPVLLYPQPYYEIKSVADFAIESANIYFYSPMLIAPPSGFRSLDYAAYTTDDGVRRLSLDRGYQRYWKEWVDWVNAVYRELEVDDSEDIDVYFKLLAPEWDEERKMWIVLVVSCTPDGRVYDFGFEPTGDGDQSTADFIRPEDAAAPPISTTPTDVPPPQIPTTTPRVVTREEIESEALKKEKEQELVKKRKDADLDRLLKMKADAISEVKLWKELDDKEEYEIAKTRLRSINKDIDKLRSGD